MLLHKTQNNLEFLSKSLSFSRLKIRVEIGPNYTALFSRKTHQRHFCIRQFLHFISEYFRRCFKTSLRGKHNKEKTSSSRPAICKNFRTPKSQPVTHPCSVHHDYYPFINITFITQKRRFFQKLISKNDSQSNTIRKDIKLVPHISNLLKRNSRIQ